MLYAARQKRVVMHLLLSRFAETVGGRKQPQRSRGRFAAYWHKMVHIYEGSTSALKGSRAPRAFGFPIAILHFIIRPEFNFCEGAEEETDGTDEITRRPPEK